MKRPSLTTQIIIGLIAGIVLGAWYKESWPEPENINPFVSNMQMFSDIFLRLIKMIIAPLVFSLLLTGIAKTGDFKTVGRIGLKTLIYFTSATIVALFIGLVIVNIFEPGKALKIQEAAAVTVQAKEFNGSEFIKHIFPESIVDAMAHNQILPIIIFVLFFGVAVSALEEKGKLLVEFFDIVAHAMLKVTSYVMKLAPLAVFGAMSSVIALKGLGVLHGYMKIILCLIDIKHKVKILTIYIFHHFYG